VIITRLENASLLIGKLSRVTCEKVLLRLSLLDSLFSKRSCAAYSLVDIFFLFVWHIYSLGKFKYKPTNKTREALCRRTSQRS
jgi:hypothetical protein